MSETQIDANDEALTEVLRQSGLTTKKDAVNEAPPEELRPARATMRAP